jgi:DNA-binding GntR family transcriptional regulator
MTTAVEAVAAALRREILAGRLPPGAPLRETALSTRFEVARHTLRAALRALAAERLVTVRPHRGATVAALDDAELAALFEYRTALEVEAEQLRAGRGGPVPDLDELERACTTGDRSAIDAAHTAFHHALVAAAGSPRITQAHAGLAAESRLALLQSRDRLPPPTMLGLHRSLLAALPRDGPAAVRAHLGTGRAAAEPDSSGSN